MTRERLPDYGDDGWGAADVFVYNDKSKALFRSLGAKAHWIVSWYVLGTDFVRKVAVADIQPRGRVELSSVGEPM